MWHKILFAGRLTKDAVKRFAPDGKAVASFTVAVDDGFGENKKTIWLNVSTWNKTAEACANLRKGAMVLCEATLHHDGGNPRLFKRTDGSTGSSFEVTASTVRFLSSKEQDELEEMPF